MQKPTLVMKCGHFGDHIGLCPVKEQGVPCYNCKVCQYEVRYPSKTFEELEKEEELKSIEEPIKEETAKEENDAN